MAVAARKLQTQPSHPEPTKKPVVEVAGGVIGVESPALALQRLIEDAYARGAEEPSIKKWHPVVRLSILCGLTLSTWTGLFIGARALCVSHG